MTTISRYKNISLFVVVLALVSFIYSTHLNLTLIPKGYDLLYHLGNVFALQIKFDFIHNSLASFGISPLIFHDYGYGTHLFYPPLAHLIPALISFLLTKIHINSTLLAIRLFSFLTIFCSGAAMFFTAKKITNNKIYAAFASLLYLSAPYLQMDYYWRGGMSSSLCFVFLPILLLSLFYFIKEKFAPFLFTFVISLTLIIWTHMITGFYSFIFFVIALTVNFFFTKKRVAAIISTLVSGLMIGIMTSPFWNLLLQQYALHTHVIFSPNYPFTIAKVTHNTISYLGLFDIQFAVWEFKIRSLTAIFNLITLIFFVAFVLLSKQIRRNLENRRFFYTLIGMLITLLIMVTTQISWRYLPDYFAFIQFPHRLLLQATPILSLLISLPFILIRAVTRRLLIVLGFLSIFIVTYTFMFNNFQLYELGTIDYTTHSIIQAMGVEQEYLPIKTKGKYKTIDDRSYTLLPLTNTENATPSATIITNETPYLLAEIRNNESKQTIFELPRLFYAGYKLKWQAENASEAITLSYSQSKDGLITTVIPGNGTLEMQYTGGWWYTTLCFSAVVVLGYLLALIYKYSCTKKPVWLERI